MLFFSGVGYTAYTGTLSFFYSLSRPYCNTATMTARRYFKSHVWSFPASLPLCACPYNLSPGNFFACIALKTNVAWILSSVWGSKRLLERCNIIDRITIDDCTRGPTTACWYTNHSKPRAECRWIIIFYRRETIYVLCGRKMNN